MSFLSLPNSFYEHNHLETNFHIFNHSLHFRIPFTSCKILTKQKYYVVFGNEAVQVKVKIRSTYEVGF